jgi:TRAP-type C4-dicarboxylate transport system substrate-binding protein
MRRTTANRGAQAALSAATIALVLAGCGGGSSDKAGGARTPKPTVLTMANGNGLTGELEPFAAAARRLSGGTLRIEFKSAWREGTPGYETGVIGDVKAGTADLGWAGSRAFDSVGVAAFDALHAPLLIDSYALQRRALQSPLVREMLGGLKPLGVVGLGILPGPLRKPLGVSRLVGPADYAGKTLAFQRSRVAEQTLRALGARGAEIPFAGAIDAYDGVEQEILSIAGSGYDAHAKYLTTNVNLWPRPVVIFMNRKAFDKLNGRQRTALHDAARVALPATLAIQQAEETEEGAGELCRRGVHFVTAGKADLAALRRAVQPVYDQLQRDAQTKAAIEQIQAMRSQVASTPDAPACSNTGSAPVGTRPATPIDGVYRVHTTPEDLRAAGASSGEVNPENYGSSKMVLDRGRVTLQQPAGDSAAGTYTVAGHTVTLTFTRGAGGPARTRPGEAWYFGWSRYRDQLTFGPVPGKVSPPPMRVEPWRRIGNAP